MEYIKNDLHSDDEKEKRYISELAPVVIFAYNRKDHLEKTIDALSENVYAKDTVVYVFSDGAKPNHVEGVQEVRGFLHRYDKSRFKNFIVVERDDNWGLGKNIINGVTEVVRKHKKIIVLEDDVVTSKYYLQYMNDALILYNDYEEVMEVAGFVPRFVNFNKSDEAFFLKWPISWGWGTWERSWIKFEREPENLIKNISEEDKYIVNINGNEEDQWNQVLRNHRGEIYTWGIFWSVSIVRNKGVVLYSGNNLCKNIGFDGSGENSGNINIDEFSENDIVSSPVNRFPSTVKVSANDENNYIKSIKKRNSKRKLAFYRSIPKRLIRKIKGK